MKLNFIEKDEGKSPIRKESLKDKIQDFFEATAMIWLIAGLFIVFGGLWYFFSIPFCGMMFFGILAVLAFGLFTGGFANLSDWFEKKLGESKGMTIGCLGMLLGPVAAVGIFVASIPYWDYDKHYEQQNSYTVYYTLYGDCYHSSPNCFHIKGHEIHSINSYNAEHKGLRPCSDCY